MPFSSFVTKQSLSVAALIIVLLGGAFLVLYSNLSTASYPLAAGDHISTWQWSGVYAAEGAQHDATLAEITQLKASLGKGTASDYATYVGLASEYELLGEGKLTYQYLSKAIALDSKQGIAYMNMGHLMEELGALHTAATAYAAAVRAEPGNQIFANAQKDFLARHPGLSS